MVFSADDISGMGFPIIVEMWDRKNYGRGKREYLKEFNEAERRKLGELYKLFYKWYLVSGVPQEYSLDAAQLSLIDRAVRVFGSI